MNWYKVKTALIVMFAFINVFLITNIVYNNVKNCLEDRKLRETTVAVLEKNNILINADQIPESSPLMSIVPVASVTADKHSLAKKLTGSTQAEVDDGVYAEYVMGEKKLSVKNTIFYYEDAAAEVVTPNQDTVKTTSQQLTALGFDMENTTGGVMGSEIVYTIRLEGKRLFTNSLTVIPGKTAPARITGAWVWVATEAGRPFEVRPAHEALVDFLRDPNRPIDRPITITKIELGYSILLGDENVNYITADAIPTWRIETSGKIDFYYDARPM